MSSGFNLMTSLFVWFDEIFEMNSIIIEKKLLLLLSFRLDFSFLLHQTGKVSKSILSRFVKREKQSFCENSKKKKIKHQNIKHNFLKDFR